MTGTEINWASVDLLNFYFAATRPEGWATEAEGGPGRSGPAPKTKEVRIRGETEGEVGRKGKCEKV